jgi:hypothetical protein
LRGFYANAEHAVKFFGRSLSMREYILLMTQHAKNNFCEGSAHREKYLNFVVYVYVYIFSEHLAGGK